MPGVIPPPVSARIDDESCCSVRLSGQYLPFAAGRGRFPARGGGGGPGGGDRLRRDRRLAYRTSARRARACQGEGGRDRHSALPRAAGDSGRLDRTSVVWGKSV